MKDLTKEIINKRKKGLQKCKTGQFQLMAGLIILTVCIILFIQELSVYGYFVGLTISGNDLPGDEVLQFSRRIDTFCKIGMMLIFIRTFYSACVENVFHLCYPFWLNVLSLLILILPSRLYEANVTPLKIFGFQAGLGLMFIAVVSFATLIMVDKTVCLLGEEEAQANADVFPDDKD